MAPLSEHNFYPKTLALQCVATAPPYMMQSQDESQADWLECQIFLIHTCI
jgi:hypothetical protein